MMLPPAVLDAMAMRHFQFDGRQSRDYFIKGKVPIVEVKEQLARNLKIFLGRFQIMPCVFRSVGSSF